MYLTSPEYNKRGFRAAAEVAFDPKDILDELKIKSHVKSSGKTGLHIYIPTIPKFSYDKTRSFAELIGKILMSKFPNKITTEWSTSKRKGKVFFNHNQISRGKTIASVWSVRPTHSATDCWKLCLKFPAYKYQIIDFLNRNSAKNGILALFESLNGIFYFSHRIEIEAPPVDLFDTIREAIDRFRLITSTEGLPIYPGDKNANLNRQLLKGES